MATTTPTNAFLRHQGSVDADVDGSTTPIEYTWTADGPHDIARMLVLIQDTGAFQANLYGNGVALRQGLGVEARDADGTILDLLDGVPIRTNAEWGGRCYDIKYFDIGNGDDYLLVRWTFELSGVPVHLEDGAELVVRVNDDLTGLSSHRFQIQGRPSAMTDNGGGGVQTPCVTINCG